MLDHGTFEPITRGQNTPMLSDVFSYGFLCQGTADIMLRNTRGFRILQDKAKSEI